MGKFPNYSLLQELTMQGMMILLILGYIAYDFMEEWGFSSYIIIAACGTGVIFLFRNQIKSMRTAKILIIVSSKPDFKVRRNFVFSTAMNLLILGFTLLHFYLYHVSNKPFDPLYSEYGIGILLGAGIWIYDYLKGEVIISEQGVVTGSKLRPTILCWSAVDKAISEKGTVRIIPKNTFGIRSIEVRGIRATQQLATLLRIHNKMK